ncbi:nucleoside-diphosphate kinase [Candidatus Micrarchaeota archaeon]|nr:nucleoside-diphosphate kinase [Candidatus Micrarchaeota archaeon]
MTIDIESNSFERTLVIFKPDCLERHLVGLILNRFEDKGLKIVGIKMIWMPKEKGEIHYEQHKQKPFFDFLVQYITSGPVIVGILEGKDAISVVRRMIGPTNSREASPGTIRGDFSMSQQNTLIHSSDSIEAAKREINIFFKGEEVVPWKRTIKNRLYGEEELQ